MNKYEVTVDWHQPLSIQFLASEPPQVVRPCEAVKAAWAGIDQAILCREWLKPDPQILKARSSLLEPCVAI